jgi:mono/diheme cytochrome c family protein
MRTALTLGLLFAAGTAPAADPSADALGVLRANCYRCHGQDGSREGGFGTVLDLAALRERKLVVPGDAGRSKLFRRVANGRMPPADESPRPSAADVATLKTWIEAGAQGPAITSRLPDVPDNARVYSLILADLERLDRRARRFQRYFTIAPLARAGANEAVIQSYRVGLAKLLNSLSWHPLVAELHRVDPAGLVLRVDLRDLLWDNTLWTRLAAEYPYGVAEDSGAFRAAATNAATRLPVVRADWFLATASRPPLYYDLLQLPTTTGELERQLRIDAAGDIRQERVARAGFNSSGVSRNNRLIERHVGPHGAYWRTYDFDAVPQNLIVRQDALPDRRNLFAYPLGPGNTDATFKHAGGEIIWHLPNGLLGFMLVNANDVRIDKAPTAIVSDPRRPDRAVEPGVSCMSCHLGGIQPKADQVREHVARNPAAYPKADAEIVRALYPPEAQMTKLMTADADRFRAALEKVCGKVTDADPVSSAAVRYEADVDLRTAAAEVGLPPAELRRRLTASEPLARNFGPLRGDGATVHRQVFQQAFGELARELRLGTPAQTASLTGNLPDNTGDLDPLEGPSSLTNAGAFSPDHRLVLLASADRSVRLMEVASGRELRRFVGHRASVWAVAWSPDGKLALSGGLDGTVRLWNVATGQELRRIDAHEGLVSAVAFLPDGRRALSAGYDHSIAIWDRDSGRELSRIDKLGSVAHCAAVSADGRWAVVGGDPLAWLIDLRTGQIRRRLSGHGAAVVAAGFSPDGKQAATAGDDGTVHLWEVESGVCVRTLGRHGGGAKAIAFAGDQIISGDGDGLLRCWHLDRPDASEISPPFATAAALAMSASGDDVLTVGRDSTIRLWPQQALRAGSVGDGTEKEPPLTLPARTPMTIAPISNAGLSATLSGPVLSPNGRWLYVLDRTAGKLLRLNASTLRTTRSETVADGAAFALAPDGRAAYVTDPHSVRGAGGKLLVVDAETLTATRTIDLPVEPYDVAAGSNERVFVSGGGTGWTDVTVVDATAGSVRARWGGVWSRSFITLTPDVSRLLVSTQGVTPGRLESLPLPEPLADKPDAYPAPAYAKVGGPFVATPDGRHLLCHTGTVVRLAGRRSEDLQPAADVGPFLAVAADAGHGTAYLLREDGTLDVLSYPDFTPQASYRVGIAAFGATLDAKAGRLYIAGIPLAALRDRQRAKAVGDVLVFDVRTLPQGFAK